MKTARQLMITALASLALAAPGLAQTPAAQRYPWDQRPASCASPAGASAAACRADDWPSYAATAERLDMLASMGRYALLERALTELAYSGHRFPDGENTARVVLDAVEEKAAQHRQWPGGNSPLDRWRAQFPGSEFVRLVDALLVAPAEGEKKLQAASPAFRKTAVWQLARQRLDPDRQRLAAARSAPEPYPWDQRPPKCHLPGAAASPQCQANDWPDGRLTLDRLLILLERSDFALLERALTELGTSPALFAGGDSPAALAYRVLEEILQQDVRVPPADSWLARWRQARPDSSAMLQLLEGIRLQRKAWEVRGSGYASTVSRESWELFAEHLQQAEQLLLGVPEPLRQSPLWHLALLRVELDNRKPQVPPGVVFRNAVRQWPRHLDFYELMVFRLLPQWGGSWEEVEAFIDHWSRQLEATQGQSYYARLYASLSGQMTQARTAMKWGRMQAGFEDWLARDPTPDAMNKYASFACQARDKSAFGKALGRIPAEQLMPRMWLSEYSYEVCTRWAGS